MAHHVAMRHMVVAAGDGFHLLATPGLDGVVEHDDLPAAAPKLVGCVERLGRAPIESSPIDVLASQEVIQDVVAGVAEQPQGFAAEYRNRRDVEPPPHPEHEDGFL